MHKANQIVEQIKASIPEQYQPTDPDSIQLLEEDIQQQVLSQHLAVQLSHYADQPSDGKKHLGRVVISGGTSLLSRVPGCRISRDLDIITSLKQHEMKHLLEKTLSQDKDDLFTYKILKAEKTKSRNGDTYVVQVFDGNEEYTRIKIDAIRGVPEEYQDTEALTVQDPLISSRASTTIKLIDPGKYIAGKIAALFPLDYKGQRKETSRWKDLGDLMIMASHVPISPDTIQRGLKYIENLHNSLNKLFEHRPNSNRPYTKSFRIPAELDTIRNDAQRNEDIVADRVRPPQGEKPEDTRKRKGFEQRQLIQHCSVVHSLKKVFERLSRLLDPCFHHMEPHRRVNKYRKELRTFARSPQMWVPGEEEAGLGVWENRSKAGDLPEKLREMRGDYVLGKGFENNVTISKRSEHGITINNVLPKGYGTSQKQKNDSKDIKIDNKKYQENDKKQNNAQSLLNNYNKYKGVDMSSLENKVDDQAVGDSTGDQELNTNEQKEEGEVCEGEDDSPENRDDNDDDNNQGMQL